MGMSPTGVTPDGAASASSSCLRVAAKHSWGSRKSPFPADGEQRPAQAPVRGEGEGRGLQGDGDGHRNGPVLLRALPPRLDHWSRCHQRQPQKGC